MGAHFGVVGSTYQHWEVDGAGISAEVRQILNDLGVNLQWLDTGEGDMLRPGVKLDVVVVDGRKQLRKTVQAHAVTTGGGSSTATTARLEGTVPSPEAVARVEVTPPILPSMVALAAQMVDTVIQAMPPEIRPADSDRWEAYATIARFLAQEKAEGKDGLARTFLLGLKVEWAEARTESGA